MENIFKIFLCVLFIFNASAKNERILGGEPADFSDFTHLVALNLFSLDSFFCAGSIITTQHILTAAHCVHNLTHGTDDIWMLAGTSSLIGNGGFIYYVRNVYPHPEFEDSTIGRQQNHNDIAIIVPQGFIIFGPNVNAIELPTRNVIPLSSVTICGWGITNQSDREFSNILMRAKVRIIPRSTCPHPVGDDQFCTLKRDVSVLYGDSGGSVIKGGKLIGIISYGFPWISNSPDRHTNVYKHLNFIHSIIYPNNLNF